MESIDSETTSLVTNTTLEIRIEDFRTTKTPKQISKRSKNDYDYWDYRFLALTFPDGINKDTEGFVVVILNERRHSQSSLHHDDLLTWTVSIIDYEGNLRLPCSFTKFPFGEQYVATDFSEAKYLERSLILNRADEFLPNGVLTLHCSISYTWNVGARIDTFPLDMTDIADTETSSSANSYLNDFMSSIPNVVCFKNVNDSTDSINISNPTIRVFDLSFQILTLPKFHELRKRFGVDGISPGLSYHNIEPEYDFPKRMDHIWIFDTEPDRFLISLDQQKGSFGTQLLESSAVIKCCVNAPMKEKCKKRIVFSNVKSQTFIIVLYYLRCGTLIFSNLQELVDVYEMAHIYEMKELHQKCIEHMVSSFNLTTVAAHLVKIANLHSDEHLLKLLDLRSCEFENSTFSERNTLQSKIMNSRPDFECYI